MISCPAANGIRWVKPSSATLSPSWTRSRTASSSERSSATVDHPQHVAQVEQMVLHRPLGPGGIALLDRGEQGLVLLDHGGVDDRLLEQLGEGRLHDLEDPAGERLQHP